MSAETHPLTFIDPDCGKPAFHTTHVPLLKDPIVAARYEWLDGRPKQPDDLFACESCGRNFCIVYFGIPGVDQRLMESKYYIKRA